MDPFIAEIRMFGLNFNPRGWAQCNGQILSIAQNTALFSLLGTTYGGNGQSTFGLPNLMGRAAMGNGQGPGLSTRDLGEEGGSASVTLLASQMPVHTHTARGNDSDGTLPSPAGNVWAGPGADRDLAWYNNGTPNTAMSPTTLSVAGGGFPHNNMMPYLTMTFCIALQGVFPTRN